MAGTVTDHDDGVVAAEFLNLVDQRLVGFPIERGAGFIQQHEWGWPYESPRQT